LFRKLLRGSRYDYWTDPANMDFLDRATILRDWPEHLPPPEKVVRSGLPLGPFSSNVVAIASAGRGDAGV
jgi:hypothetical protein